MFNRILVPLDGSDLAESILPYVSLLSTSLKVPVLLLSVVDPGALDLPIDEKTLMGPWEAALRRRLDDAKDRLTDHGVEAEAMIVDGRTNEQIIRLADTEGCDLIAMSTNGRGLIGWGMLGSVTYHIVHRSSVPVITVTPRKVQNLSPLSVKVSRIPVPLDGSPLAESALPYAEYLAKKLSAEILLIRAVAADSVLPSILANLLPSRLEEKAMEEAENYLKEIARRLESHGQKVSWRVLKGTPGPEIVEVARESPDDLIAMTTHGKSGIIPGVLGNVSISVLRNSGDPVLIIPPSSSS